MRVFILAILFSINLYAGEKINITVKGMVCSFCSQGITKKFKEMPQVKEVNVNLDNHLVTLELNDNKKLDDGAIETILKDAGYAVEKISH